MSKHPPVPEPVEIKSLIRALLESAPKKGSYIVFTGNQFPQHLWKHWASELRRQGLSWQDLLKAISIHAQRVLEWASGSLQWEELAETIWATLEQMQEPGPSGERRGQGRRARPLTDFL